MILTRPELTLSGEHRPETSQVGLEAAKSQIPESRKMRKLENGISFAFARAREARKIIEKCKNAMEK